MNITSTTFQDDEQIPQRHTCDGENINPPLTFSDVPLETRSLVLIVEDPDAPLKPNFIHWVLGNIPPTTEQIKENSTPENCVVGVNDFGESKYSGPCPPSGTHRYIFQLFALDTTLDLNPGYTKEQLQEIIQGHILEAAELVGLYKS